MGELPNPNDDFNRISASNPELDFLAITIPPWGVASHKLVFGLTEAGDNPPANAVWAALWSL